MIIDSTKQNIILGHGVSVSMMLAGLYFATAIDVQVSRLGFLSLFTLEFQALSGQSSAIVTRALETL